MEPGLVRIHSPAPVDKKPEQVAGVDQVIATGPVGDPTTLLPAPTGDRLAVLKGHPLKVRTTPVAGRSTPGLRA